jgi:hypothetical protein
MTKLCKSCDTEKALDQFHKRSNRKSGVHSYCKQCRSSHFKEWYAKNKEVHHSRYKEFKQNNPEWAVKYHKEHQKNNRPMYARNAAKRRASELQATPSWLTEDDTFIFNEIYEMRDIRSNDTGVVHHVDHIIPLQGVEACGLHTWWNLQLLPASENISKSNKVGDYV